MPRALKVFRLPIGFHDAYVAAPTKKAAIEAWGSDKDVFQRGQAELVTDPKLTKEPLASPGEVVKRLRGTAAEQIAALGETKRPATRKGANTEPEEEVDAGPARKGKAKPPPKPKPRPSRARLDEAEQALAKAEARHEAALKDLREREAAFARERKALEAKQEAERKRLEAQREKAEAVYREALERWRES